MSYTDFLARKRRVVEPLGDDIDASDLHPRLFPFQRDLTTTAIRTGRSAIWADVGLGKSGMSIEWSRCSGKTSLIVAPLAVSSQTVREAAKLDVDARYVRHGEEITGPGVWVTNYEMVDRFDPSQIDAVVLDEASILKAYDGKTRARLISHFRDVPRRLACTATPAPNDPEELTGQAEFLGVSTRVDMLATWFTHDADGWRVKGHARESMFDWMAGWASALRRPSDLGYSDEGYELPDLRIVPEIVPAHLSVPDGELFAPTSLGGVSDRARVRRDTVGARCARAADLALDERDEPWLLWTGLNAEADELARLIPGAVNVHGSLPPERKAELLLGFADGDYRVLITKPSIAGWGMNWQHCARMAFVGLSDSYESYYQSIGRCLRFGQTRPVNAHVVLTEAERAIADNVARKQRDADTLRSGLVAAMRRRQEIAA